MNTSVNQETNTSPEQSMKFSEAFGTLKSVAEAMRSQTNEPDIDALVPMVDKAVTAYNLCKTRIAAVKQLLEQKLGNELQ